MAEVSIWQVLPQFIITMVVDCYSSIIMSAWFLDSELSTCDIWLYL